MTKKPEKIASNLHCVTDLLTLLTIMVAKHGQEQLITLEMVQDYGDYDLFLESNYTTPNIRLSVRKRRAPDFPNFGLKP